MGASVLLEPASDVRACGDLKCVLRAQALLCVPSEGPSLWTYLGLFSQFWALEHGG